MINPLVLGRISPVEPQTRRPVRRPLIFYTVTFRAVFAAMLFDMPQQKRSDNGKTAS
jgi:hypothetical protein